MVGPHQWSLNQCAYQRGVAMKPSKLLLHCGPIIPKEASKLVHILKRKSEARMINCPNLLEYLESLPEHFKFCGCCGFYKEKSRIDTTI